MQKTSSSHSLSSRSKRSRTDLSNLRLSPLTTREPAPAKRASKVEDPQEEYADPAFLRSHSSYLQGKPAPTTPGILSRSSSRRHLGGGLSRRGSLYEDDDQHSPRIEYAGVVRDESGDMRLEVGSGQIPKAKSEAALLVQRNKLARKGILSPEKHRRHYARPRTGGTNTPRQPKPAEDDWITRTGAATNALLQESKGQSWIASRESSTSLTHLQDTTDEDDDEGYEEMAAMSRQKLRSGETSPLSTRASRWGSRYGSRTGSRRNSRRGSLSGGTAESRTPVPAAPGGLDGGGDYFEVEKSVESVLVDAEEEDESSHDEETVARLTESRSFGLGGLVDRIMNFNLFKVEEREESTEDESHEFESPAASEQSRVEDEALRRKQAKEKLVTAATLQAGDSTTGQVEAGWSDAAWLLSVASKAIL